MRESVQQQAEVIRADLGKKELEWKNTYKGRMMTRVGVVVAMQAHTLSGNHDGFGCSLGCRQTVY